MKKAIIAIACCICLSSCTGIIQYIYGMASGTGVGAWNLNGSTGWGEAYKPAEPMQLFLPKESDNEGANLTTSNTLTLILLRDSVISYTGILQQETKAKYTQYEEVSKIVAAHKKSKGNTSFVIAIKPTPESGYKNTVDVLDEMTINKIKDYVLVDLTDAEKKRFYLSGQQQNVYTTVSTSTKIITPKNGLVLTIGNDRSISWKFIHSGDTTQPITIQPSTTANIKKVVSEIKEKMEANGEKFELTIEGANDLKYEYFKTVIEALKELGIYKFNMISS